MCILDHEHSASFFCDMEISNLSFSSTICTFLLLDRTFLSLIRRRHDFVNGTDLFTVGVYDLERRSTCMILSLKTLKSSRYTSLAYEEATLE